MKKIAVLVAGGTGSRMNSTQPKQFMMLGDQPVLVHTIKAFQSAFQDISIILVLPSSVLADGTTMMQDYFPGHTFQIVAGGTTRFQSVYNGLQQVDDDSIVFVHDAVRCLVSDRLIRTCYQAAIEFGSAVPAIDVKDSIRIIDNSGQNHSIDRSKVKIIQTPQVFRTDQLKLAFQQPFRDIFTDEANVWESAGHSVNLVAGELNNIKITYPSDLQLAEQILSQA